MATRIISIQPGVPSFRQRVALDGAEFLLQFAWNQRSAKWYLSVYDTSETPLALNLKVVADWPLTRLITDERMFPGEVFALDTTGEGIDPGLSDLGARVKLIYIDAADLYNGG